MLQFRARRARSPGTPETAFLAVEAVEMTI
jgi:hypothetical protein